MCANPQARQATSFMPFFSHTFVSISLHVCPQKRSVEDLKERYYHICAKLANVRAVPGTDLKIPVFDAGHERRRKEQLERLYNRTPEQVSPESHRLFSRPRDPLTTASILHALRSPTAPTPHQPPSLLSIALPSLSTPGCSESLTDSPAPLCPRLPSLPLEFRAPLSISLAQVAEEEYLLQELRKIEARKKEREKRSQDLQKLITAADTTAEQRRTERKAPKKKLPQKKEAEKPVWRLASPA